MVCFDELNPVVSRCKKHLLILIFAKLFRIYVFRKIKNDVTRVEHPKKWQPSMAVLPLEDKEKEKEKEIKHKNR